MDTVHCLVMVLRLLQESFSGCLSLSTVRRYVVGISVWRSGWDRTGTVLCRHKFAPLRTANHTRTHDTRTLKCQRIAMYTQTYSKDDRLFCYVVKTFICILSWCTNWLQDVVDSIRSYRQLVVVIHICIHWSCSKRMTPGDGNIYLVPGAIGQVHSDCGSRGGLVKRYPSLSFFFCRRN